uniref:CHHC U11-48K-type domain-containing protein n=1 Tax=Tetranychus urticae TaxID=32264 RepID=T1KH91_TETUR
MATFWPDDYQKITETCPYNPTHKVTPAKFAMHLVSCEKKSKKILVKCPYNFYHRIDPALLDAHLAECASFKKDGWKS